MVVSFVHERLGAAVPANVQGPGEDTTAVSP